MSWEGGKLQNDNIQWRSRAHCIASLSGSKEDRKDVQDEMGFGMLSSLIIRLSSFKLIFVSLDKASLCHY
jgi:hypothetical protein